MGSILFNKWIFWLINGWHVHCAMLPYLCEMNVKSIQNEFQTDSQSGSNWSRINLQWFPKWIRNWYKNEFIMDTKMVSQFIPKWIVDECENVSKWDINIDQYCPRNESKNGPGVGLYTSPRSRMDGWSPRVNSMRATLPPFLLEMTSESPTRAPSAALVARRWRNRTICLSSAFKIERRVQHCG